MTTDAQNRLACFIKTKGWTCYIGSNMKIDCGSCEWLHIVCCRSPYAGKFIRTSDHERYELALRMLDPNSLLDALL